MDRRKYPVSVVPYPIDKASSLRRDMPDDSAEWDAKWLRPTPKVSVMPSVQTAQTAAPVRQMEDEEPAKLPFHLRFLHWLFPEINQRRATRYATPGLVAYYWTGGAPYSHQIGDISATGLFLLTKERWAPGTLIQMTLQQQDGRASKNNSICVLSEVVRWGENGSGFNFVLSDYEDVQTYGIQPSEALDRKAVERFLHRAGIPGRL